MSPSAPNITRTALPFSMPSDDVPTIERECERDLAIALHERDFARATALLDGGAPINRTIHFTQAYDRDIVDDTCTYLITAAIAGHASTVKFLLDRGADPNVAGSYSGRTALLAAASYGYADVVDLLLMHDANVAAFDSYNKQTSIGYAVANVNPQIVRSLLAAGAVGDFRRLGFSTDGDAKAREVVQLLVDYGADINKLDDWGRTPLMWAAQYAAPETVQLMIELGANVHWISVANMNGVKSNETALALAREKGPERDGVVAVLLKHGAKEIRMVRRHGSLLSRLWDDVFR